MATGGAVYICVNFLCTCARLAEWSASQDLSAHCPACGFDPDGILLHLLFFLLLVIFSSFDSSVLRFRQCLRKRVFVLFRAFVFSLEDWFVFLGFKHLLRAWRLRIDMKWLVCVVLVLSFVVLLALLLIRSFWYKGLRRVTFRSVIWLFTRFVKLL